MAKYLLLSVFLLSGALAASQTTPPPQPRMSDMMQQHQQMMAELKASDQRLEELVRAMNTAKGDAKIEAMAQAITELVHQQQALHERMGMMMMSQMSTGMMGGKGAPAGK
jgi:flagellar biosynthesis/type III secretory pathway chaperone